MFSGIAKVLCDQAIMVHTFYNQFCISEHLHESQETRFSLRRMAVETNLIDFVSLERSKTVSHTFLRKKVFVFQGRKLPAGRWTGVVNIDFCFPQEI